MTPSRRISPGLPETQVNQAVSQGVGVRSFSLVDPNPRAYDVGQLTAGLEFFTKKAAERKLANQEEARAKGEQFLKSHPEAFEAAVDDKSLNVAIRNAARDGSIPIGLQPDFQRGLKNSIAQRRLQTADVNLSQWTAGYTGLNDAGEPKPIQEVIQDIQGAFDEITGEALGDGLSTDPDVSGYVSDTEARLRDNFVQTAFVRSLEARMNWALNHAQAGFSQIAGQVAAPLSDVEQTGFHAVLSEFYKQSAAKGIPDPSIPLVDAALVNADALKGEQGVDAALHFLDSVLDFQVDGKPLSELPDRASELIKKRAQLQAGRAEDIQREEYERGAMIRRLEGVVDEALGDSSQLIKDGKYDEARARVLQALEEAPDYSQDTDGTIGRYLDQSLDARRGEQVIDIQAMRAATDAIATGKIPENWREVWGDKVTLETRSNLAQAERAQSNTDLLKQLVLAPISQRIESRARDIVTTDAGAAGNQYVNSQVRELADEAEIAAFQFAQSTLSDPNLTDAQRQSLISKFEQDYDQKVVQPRIQGLISELQTQREGVEGVITSAQTLTTQGIRDAQQGLNFLRPRLDPTTEQRLTIAIDKANATLASVEAEIQTGSQTFQLFNQQLLQDMEIPEDGAIPSTHPAVLEVFEEIQADREKFVQSLAVEGQIPPGAVQREIDRRISQKLMAGGDENLTRILAERQAARTFTENLAQTESPEAKIDLYLNSMTLISTETRREFERFRDESFYLPGFFRSGTVNLRTGNTTQAQRFVDYINTLEDAEAAEAIAPWAASPQDVLEGVIRLRSQNFAGGPRGQASQVLREVPADDIDWSITPMAGSKRALKEALDKINDQGRLPEFLEKVRFKSRAEFENAQERVFSIRS